MFITEIVSWNANLGVTDEKMIQAVNALLPDLKKLPGFYYQGLGKTPQGRWVDIYYWDSVKNAHASNELMSGTHSLSQLMALIQLDSVVIDIIEPQQASSSLTLAFEDALINTP